MSALPSLARPLPHSSVVIDGSMFLSSDASDHASFDVLIDWIAGFPTPGSIRVFLPSVADQGRSRKIQSALQSLGCTVTRRLSCTAA